MTPTFLATQHGRRLATISFVALYPCAYNSLDDTRLRLRTGAGNREPVLRIIFFAAYSPSQAFGSTSNDPWGVPMSPPTIPSSRRASRSTIASS